MEKAGSIWERLWRGVTRLTARPDWERLLGPGWPERIMATPVTDRFHAKQGRSTGRLILEQRDGRLAVYLKRHYRLAWWQRLLALLWPGRGRSPALEEAHNLEQARALGVPVPHVVAAGEYIGPWGKLRSFLAVEELADMLPLNEALPLAAARLDPVAFQRWKRALLKEMVRLIHLLHGRKLFHKDLYFCHFYIDQADTARLPDWPGRVFLIDLHRLARHRWLSWVWQSKDLAQLLYSSDVPGVTDRDRLRFWRAYMGAGGLTWRGRWLRRAVLYRWRRYRRHNERLTASAKPQTARVTQSA